MDAFYVTLALLAGACAPTQAGINSQLRLFTQDPVLAAFVSFAVGTIALLLYALVLQISWPSFQVFVQLPTWLWTGGILGAFLVVVTVILAPKLGAATMLALMVAGQMATSLMLDHYGLIGYQEHPMNMWRVVGVLFLVTGVILLKRF
ncbi:MAG: DMT family transporter [Desulfomonile sp.]